MTSTPDARTAARALFACAALLCPVAGLAADRIAAGPGIEVRFESGVIVASRDGRDVWRRPMSSADPSGEAQLEAHALAGDRLAVHAVIAGAHGVAEAVVEVGPGGRSFGLVWEGSTEARGDPGERTAAAVVFLDLTGDDLPEIVVGTRAEQVRLCGVDDLPLLFRRVWDPATRRLRPVTAARPGLRGEGVREITGVASEPAEGPGPLIAVLTPTAVSSSAGDHGDAMLLTPPAVLLDGDPGTAWIPGNGSGAGEFATFSATAATWGLSRLGLRLLPPARRSPGHGRPASVLVATEDRVLRLVLPEGGEPGGGGTFWFDLPETLKTTCLSLVLERVEGRGGRPPALAELVAFTEIDGPGGLSRLAGELDDPDRGDAAAALLPRAGTAALRPVADAWEGLGDAGRRRAVRSVVELVITAGNADPSALPLAAALLAEAALSGDETASRAAEAGLSRTGAAAVGALEPALVAKDDGRFFRAATLLSGLEHEGALAALAAAAGIGGRSRRELLRGLLVRTAASGQGRASLLLDLLERASDAGERERMIDLARVAARVAAANARLAEVALPAYDDAEGFADRYRLLEVVARLRDDRALPRLLAAANDGDHLVRAAAVRGLPLHEAEEGVRVALGEALTDGAPEVRIAALEAFGRLGDASDAAGGIRELARTDPWPRVRTAAVALVPLLPGEQAVAAAVSAIRDPSSVVREAGLRIAARMPGGGALDDAVSSLLANEGESPELRAKAAGVAGLRCQASAVAGLRSLLGSGAEPLAPPERVDAARAAARALGAIGGSGARSALEESRERANPAVTRAIDEALERLGSGCGNPPKAPPPLRKGD